MVGARGKENTTKKNKKMFVLFETPAGFALFKVADESKVASADDVIKNFEKASSAKKL